MIKLKQMMIYHMMERGQEHLKDFKWPIILAFETRLEYSLQAEEDHFVVNGSMILNDVWNSWPEEVEELVDLLDGNGGFTVTRQGWQNRLLVIHTDTHRLIHAKRTIEAYKAYEKAKADAEEE